MTPDILTILDELVVRIENLEARLQKVEEPLRVVHTLKSLSVAENAEAYRIIGGLIAFADRQARLKGK